MKRKVPKAVTPVAEPVIVSAVGVAAHSLDGNTALAAAVEAAMSQAVTDALKDGVSITDSAAIKARILAARARVRAEAGLPED